MEPGTADGDRPPEFEELETLPAAGGDRYPAMRPALALPARGVERVEELLEALPAVEEPDAAERPERLDLHTIRELFDLVADDSPAVAAEGGIYRVQRHAYGRSGGGGRDPGLRRLAAAVIGGSPPRSPGAPARSPDGEPLRLLPDGIDLDAFAAGSAADAAEPFTRALNRLCRRAKAIGAALLVRESSGGYRARQVTGILRRSAGRLTYAPADPVAARYLTRRVTVIAVGSPYRLAGMAERLPAAARSRIARLALLPAQAGGRPAYLLLAAADDGRAWDAPTLAARLGLVRAAGSGTPESLGVPESPGRPPP